MVLILLQTFVIITLLIACQGARGEAGPSQMPAPTPRAELFKRVESTCGYARGVSTSSIVCKAGNWCRVNTQASVIGCCSSSCILVSDCVPYTSISEETSMTIEEGTTYCTNSATPDCAVGSYVEGDYSGYTWPICRTASGTIPILEEPLTTTGDESTTRTAEDTETTTKTKAKVTSDSEPSSTTRPTLAQSPTLSTPGPLLVW
ncbi:hypothetical protein X797_011035 [Metarhizium robertsii]|uniref:Uncharacterized protein n=1 Tax=Metarhizium robertsii TaxID=568076 RepID=A0A014PJH6_9HYPO|nr:hypothetical protein X797_011035 [Metarhizium robertsii]